MAKRFHDALRDALTESGLPLQQVCEAANVSYEKYKKFMQRGGKNPNASTTVDDAVKIANALGLTLDELLDDQTAKSRSEAVSLWLRLSDEERNLLQAAARGQRV